MAILSEYEKQIWDALVAEIGNEYGVAGIMGNLYWESSLIPGRVEQDFTSGYSVSVAYTNKFQAHQITREEFRYNSVPPQTQGYGPGYGLAQWTYFSRKYNYWDFAMDGSHGQPGTVAFEVWFLLWELQNMSEFSNVNNVVRSATTVRQASNVVLHEFENPTSQGASVEEQRYRTSQQIYDEYAGSSPTPTPSGGAAVWFGVFKVISRRKHETILYRHKNKPGGGF